MADLPPPPTGSKIGWLLALAAALWAHPLTAQEPARVDLRELLRRAEVHHPEVAVARAERDSARAGEDLARWTRLSPRLASTSVFGLVPGARGDIFDSPDTARDLNDLGPFWRTRLDLGLPLYTFGALGASQRAAHALVGSREARTEAKLNAARLQAARAYFGHLLAQDQLSLLAEVRAHLERLLDSLDRSEEQDPLDVYKARGYGFELDRLESEVRRAQRLAAAGLRELAGEAAQPVADHLPSLAAELPDLEPALREAMASQPELREAELAAEARALLAEAARKERLPALGVEGRFEYSEAPGRARQSNPFAYDPFNARSLTAALGLRLDLNFKQTGARARREAAEAEVQRAKAQAARVRLRLELSDLHAGLREAQGIAEAGRRAFSTAANWLRLAEENHGLDAASTKDVIEAYAAYVQSRAAHLKATHDLDLAVIAWRLACGRPPLEEGESP
ncbi:MAG TPA: TolC family protein [Vicinamibacteria bacterium]|nr:TolC family protein [Vicinamibacteria bacterium]